MLRRDVIHALNLRGKRNAPGALKHRARWTVAVESIRSGYTSGTTPDGRREDELRIGNARRTLNSGVGITREAHLNVVRRPAFLRRGDGSDVGTVRLFGQRGRLATLAPRSSR